MLEYYEYKRIGINTCKKLLIYRKKRFLFHGVMKSPTPPHKDNEQSPPLPGYQYETGPVDS